MKKLSKVLSLTVITSLFTVFALGSGSGGSTGSASSAYINSDGDLVIEFDNSDDVSQTIAEESNIEAETNTTNEIYNLPTAPDPLNMSLGDICKPEYLYIGLSYAKEMDYLPCEWEQDQSVPADHKVLCLFFEIFNGSDKLQKFREDDVSCYVDGIKVEEVEKDTIFSTIIDGHKQIGKYSVDGGTQAIASLDFEIPEAWNEIKIFYNSDCTWVLTPGDVSREPFPETSLFVVDNSRTATLEGDIIYSEEYELVYNGYEIYTYNQPIWGDSDFAVFKFRINNTGETTLSCKNIGYNMRCYQGNYLLDDDASYSIDDKIGDYINIFDTDEIHPGMSSNIYVAFPITDNGKPLYMIYDAGYMGHDILGTVYVDR